MAGDPVPQEVARRFGEQVKEQREARGLTQEKLADLVGVSRHQIQVIEGGWSDRATRRPANPKLTTLLGLCAALGGTVRIDASEPAGIVVEFSGSRGGGHLIE